MVLVRGGTIVNHDHSRRADVLIRDGEIAAVGRDLDRPAGAHMIDAGGCYVLPGGIDPHTHLELAFMVPATDHCAFTTAQKRLGRTDFTKIPNGTGGLEDRLAVLWTAGVNTGRLTKEEFVAVTSANIARILNVYPKKGAVAVGSDADLVIFDPEATKTISAKTQVSRIDYNVFEGFSCRGLPRATLSRGKVAWLDGDLRAEPGAGSYVPRPAFPAFQVANAKWQELTAPRAVARLDVTP